ncbi:MAG: endonuclease/exonuclease/phosphatase family protein [Fibrobacterales bacterium]
MRKQIVTLCSITLLAGCLGTDPEPQQDAGASSSFLSPEESSSEYFSSDIEEQPESSSERESSSSISSQNNSSSAVKTPPESSSALESSSELSSGSSSDTIISESSSSTLSSSSEIETPTTFELNIMSFNVRTGDANDGYPNDWNSRKGRCQKVIELHKPDIIGLQEPSDYQVDDLIALTGYKLASAKGTGILYNNAVVSVIETGEFHYTNTPDDANNQTLVWGQQWFRTCVWALFEHTETQQQVYVYNNHWSYVGSSWMNSATLLDSRIAQRSNQDVPFIVTGDLNVDEYDASIKYLTQQGDVQMTDTFRDIWPNRNDVKGFHGFGGGFEGAKIDFVLVGGGEYTTLDADIYHDQIDGGWPTDHFPIWGKVRFK